MKAGDIDPRAERGYVYSISKGEGCGGVRQADSPCT
jgi:hypothetical protein